MSRPVTHRYVDPLDAVWLAAASRMGLRVERGPESYATTDGHGRLILSDAEGMDPDDCLAQMIFHEICHSLIQGSQSFGWVDWGLDNEGTRDVELEHACLRLQAALASPLGLRRVLAPTTDFRSYYDALPEDPFLERSESERESIVRARAAYARRDRPPWRHYLTAALEATADIVHAVRCATSDLGSLYDTATPRRALNRLGLFRHHDEDLTCGSCAWAFESGKKTKQLRCRQAGGAKTRADEPACERFEQPFDCLSCGACCREAYDTVEVSERDPARKLHLDLMIEREGGYDMKRDGSRCACLRGGVPLTPPQPYLNGGRCNPEEGSRVAPLTMPGGAPFTCDIYETRPRTCRDFTLQSAHCLSARRTVGLSR